MAGTAFYSTTGFRGMDAPGLPRERRTHPSPSLRVEWNHEENFVIAGGDGYQITGNFFDRAGTVGIALRKNTRSCVQVAITGNFIKRSGKNAKADTHGSAQVLMEGGSGITFTGNVLQMGRDDGEVGVWSPSYGIIYGGLRNCVIAN